MRKSEELTNPASCMNCALPNEMIFVLLGRDVAAPDAIRSWVAHRLSLGKNKITDAQITGALACADTMERERVKPNAWHTPILFDDRLCFVRRGLAGIVAREEE